MTIVIDHEKLEEAKQLYREILEQVQEDNLIAHGCYMLKEDATEAAMAVLALKLYSVKK